MEFDYKYEVPREEAKTRLEALSLYLTNRHGIQVTWAGDTATFNGKYMIVKIQGEMTLDDGVVHVLGKDPGRMWRSKAMEYLQSKLAKYLDPSTPVGELPQGK